MPDLLEVARRHMRRRHYERDEINELSPPAADLNSCNSSNSYRTAAEPQTWGCHLEAVQTLLDEGDSLLAELGVPGTHPMIVRAASEVESAIHFGDFATLQHAVGEFRYATRVAAAGRVPFHCVPLGHRITKETKETRELTSEVLQ